MTPEFKEALKRGLIIAFIMAGSTFFTIIAQTDDWRLIASATGLAFFGPLVLRFGGEGMWDSARNVQPEGPRHTATSARTAGSIIINKKLVEQGDDEPYTLPVDEDWAGDLDARGPGQHWSGRHA